MRARLPGATPGDEIELHLGALDAPGRLVPTYELWTVRREPWLPPFPGTRLHERDREAQDRLVNAARSEP